ncbi:MAG TPA: VOC family protein [Gemmatimonadales bacterium]|nr:VOC family protein [Gemmatimonadales bacterium]
MRDAERALRFYKEELGCKQDWSYPEGGPAWVCQVSLFGFELILNQTDERTSNRAGRGRLFIGLDDDQGAPLIQHLKSKGVRPERRDWGRPTMVIADPDGNELFFWMPMDDWSQLDTQ